MSGHLLFMPFYGDDFVGSTDGLTGAESYAYVGWLWRAYRNGGKLPNMPSLLMRWGRIDRRHWPKIRDNVLGAHWTLSDCGTFYTNDRLDKELEKTAALSAKRSAAGKRGGRPKGATTVGATTVVPQLRRKSPMKSMGAKSNRFLHARVRAQIFLLNKLNKLNRKKVPP